jgi:hypothetical protein
MLEQLTIQYLVHQEDVLRQSVVQNISIFILFDRVVRINQLM